MVRKEKLKVETMDKAFAEAEGETQKQENIFTAMNDTFQQEKQRVELDENKFNDLNKEWEKAEMKTRNDIQLEADKKAEELQKLWTEMARSYDPNNPELMKELENKWNESFNEWNESKLAEHWQAATQLEDMQFVDHIKDYNFRDGNPYDQMEHPYKSFLAQMEKGNSYEAIQALEAHLRKNPQDHKGWKVLGSLQQELDDDQKGVSALSKAIELNPKCKDSLLLMGVSCVNVFDELHSMMYLHRWLKLNDQWSGIAGVII